MSNIKVKLNDEKLQKVAGGNNPKKIIATLKLQIPAGNATSAPPIGPALSVHGVDISKFINEFNERTRQSNGYLGPIPTVIYIYADHSFSFVTKTPPSVLKLRDGKGHGNIGPIPIDKDSFDFLK